MSHVTITLSTPAYDRLKKFKAPGKSFSDVILEELPEICATGGELLNALEKADFPRANPTLRKMMLKGRGRRSNRRRAGFQITPRTAA